jgi:hypothetical protein
MRWDPWLLALHVASDAVIFLSYFSIPFALVYFISKRKDLRFRGIFVCFAAFILSCGITHLASIDAIWSANYWLEGMLKLVCAAISAYTAYILWPTIPQALLIPSPKALEDSNNALTREIEQRKAVQGALETLNNELEIRVKNRTSELEASLKELNELRAHFTTVCAWTRRIQDHGKWISFEEFLSKHLGLHFTHGISEEGMLQLQKELEESMESPLQKSPPPPPPPAAS